MKDKNICEDNVFNPTHFSQMINQDEDAVGSLFQMRMMVCFFSIAIIAVSLVLWRRAKKKMISIRKRDFEVV